MLGKRLFSRAFTSNGRRPGAKASHASKVLIIVQLYDSPWWSFRKAQGLCCRCCFSWHLLSCELPGVGSLQHGCRRKRHRMCSYHPAKGSALPACPSQRRPWLEPHILKLSLQEKISQHVIHVRPSKKVVAIPRTSFQD